MDDAGAVRQLRQGLSGGSDDLGRAFQRDEGDFRGGALGVEALDFDFDVVDKNQGVVADMLDGDIEGVLPVTLSTTSKWAPFTACTLSFPAERGGLAGLYIAYFLGELPCHDVFSLLRSVEWPVAEWRFAWVAERYMGI
ncbi:MAG: hypothetical protein PHD37_03795 [Gallionellaceae bacterium]|nr:hypothetical protein [Gallionellaceae bacterium]